jgi:hypothetical protein
VTGSEWAWQSGSGASVKIGYVNPNGQRCCGHRGVLGTDHMQLAYKVECTKCGYVYGANGSDMHERRCPECQGGAPGIRYWKADASGQAGGPKGGR